MRIGAVYSHLNGLEWLLVHCPDIWREVEDVVGEIDAELCRTKVSRERGMQGRMLYSPTALNSEFKAQFRR